jgi:REP element-mobilizing transposase RayT
MPRRPRVHIPGAFYHVTLRGNHRQDIFFSPADRDLLNRIVARALSRCAARLHAYCWMTNHLHLLLQPDETPLGMLVLRVAGQFARAVQAGLHTTGHLFQNRYHATQVATDNQLLALVRYIHLNPVRAGIVSDPAAYPWSSHPAYAGQRAEPWLTSGFVLAMLDPDLMRARWRYLQFMNLPAAADPTTAPTEPPATGPGGVAGLSRGNKETGICQHRQTLHEIIDEAAARFDIAPAMLMAPTRARAANQARCWIARTALERGVASISATARAMGRDESSLRKALDRQRQAAKSPKRPA